MSEEIKAQEPQINSTQNDENDGFVEEKPIWFKKEKIGDSVTGIYIGKSSKENKLSGTMQTVYELRDKNGQVWYVGFPEKNYINNILKYVPFGAVMKFTYTHDKDTGNVQPCKCIKVLTKKNKEDGSYYIDPSFDPSEAKHVESIPEDYDGGLGTPEEAPFEDDPTQQPNPDFS